MGDAGENVDVGGVTNPLLVVKPDPERDLDAGERLARRLRAEFVELGDKSVALAPGGIAPPHAKGADTVTRGDPEVTLSASGGVFTALIETSRNWHDHQFTRHRISVTIDGGTIDLESASAQSQQALIDTYAQRHAGERAG